MNTINPYRDIFESYKRQQDLNRYDQKMRKLALYERIPRLQQIDLQMSQIGSEISKAIMKSPQDAEIMLQELKLSLDSLKSEKAMLMIKNDIPADYLELHPKCKKCGDTGFLETNERCTCFNQKLISVAYQMSNIEKQMEKQNFDHFNLNVFSSDINGKEGLSQRDNMMKILSESELYVTSFPNAQNLLFFGSSGLGKTYLCNAIAKSLLDKGYSVIYQTPFGIINILEKKTFTEKDNEFIRLAYDQLFTSDLLIIDDLGTETANTFTINEFYNILNTRIINEKSTIISTNIKLSEIASFYNDRIDSRIKGHFKLIKFFGPDVRWEV